MSMNSMFNNMFGKIQNGMCRLSMDGLIAIKTSSGYKTYDTKTNKLQNCDNFVFDIGSDFFFVIPTNKVAVGDIILVNGLPKCVIKVDNEAITVLNYENSTIENVLPEKHVFMGDTYFYGKIVSMFGNNLTKKNGCKTKNIFKYMMLSKMFSGSSDSNNQILPMMMMFGKDNMFDDMFDFDNAELEDTTDNNTKEN